MMHASLVNNLQNIILMKYKIIVFSADEKPFEFTTLFHTYFRVPDVTKTTVSGLKGLTYVDKVLSCDKECRSPCEKEDSCLSISKDILLNCVIFKQSRVLTFSVFT